MNTVDPLTAYCICKGEFREINIHLERLPFAWNLRVGFLGQMEQFICSGKNGSKYNAVLFVKNDPVELGRLGRLVPSFTTSSTLGENGTSEIFVNGTAYPGHLDEMKKEEYLWRHSFYSGKFSLGSTVPFDISSGFSVQMVSVPGPCCLKHDLHQRPVVEISLSYPKSARESLLTNLHILLERWTKLKTTTYS